MTAATITQLPVHTEPRQLQPWRGVRLDDIDGALRFSKAIAASGFAPKSYYPDREPDPEVRLKAATAAVFAAVQLGAEVGLSPMASVQNIALINGRPGLFGPAMLAVVRNSGLLEAIEERLEGDGDQMAALCTVTRKGEGPRTFEFNVRHAKKAGLWGKQGPWQQYPDRMLLARARTFALRDVFPDVLLGLNQSVEELRDVEVLENLPRPPGPELAPKVRQIEVILPQPMSPEYFPQTDDGISRLVQFIIDSVADGDASIPLLNVELLDKLMTVQGGQYKDTITEVRNQARSLLTDDTADADETEGAV